MGVAFVWGTEYQWDSREAQKIFEGIVTAETFTAWDWKGQTQCKTKKPLDPTTVLAGSRLRKLSSCKQILTFMKKEDPESKTKSSKGRVKSHGELLPSFSPVFSLIKETPTITEFWTSYEPVTPLCLPHSSFWTGMCSLVIYWLPHHCLLGV